MNNVFKYIAAGVVALTLLLVLAVPVQATVPGLKEVCQRNSRGTWSWGLRSTLTGDMFLYAGPVTWNTNERNAWCNANAPASPSPVAVLASAQKPKVALCHKTGKGYNYLEVDASAKDAHLDHGDFLYEGGKNWDDKWKDKWCEDHAPKPTSTPKPTTTSSPTAVPTTTASPTATPEPSSSTSPTATPTSSPTSSPTVDPSATPVATLTGTASPTSTPQPEIRTDLTDGRSDGRTDSLGCLKPSDNCNPAVGGGTVRSASLPVTGSEYNWWFLIVPALAAMLGAWMLKSTSNDWKSLRQNGTSSESQTQ